MVSMILLLSHQLFSLLTHCLLRELSDFQDFLRAEPWQHLQITTGAGDVEE